MTPLLVVTFFLGANSAVDACEIRQTSDEVPAISRKGSRADAHQHLIVPDHGFVDLLEVQDILRCAVLGPHDCLDALGAILRADITR